MDGKVFPNKKERDPHTVQFLRAFKQDDLFGYDKAEKKSGENENTKL